MSDSSGFRVTYATMSSDDDALHNGFDRGIEQAKERLGETHPFYINGLPHVGTGVHVSVSPIDTGVVVGRFAQAAKEDAVAAVQAARSYAHQWSTTPWAERVAILRRGADSISEHRNLLAALMAFEIGKNRLESLGDVEEAADLIRYYCHEMEAHDGFDLPMERLSPSESTRDVMRPYGVWGVISPFNYPMALVAGPVGAALAAGNTVVMKPSNIGALSGLEFWRIMIEAGLPAGALHVITGSGHEAGAALVSMVDGLTFTGSYDVGINIHHTFATAYPKPVICEMGGKNPAIVSRHADLDVASDGVMRSAFGFGGQKCSAASRAFIESSVYDAFVDQLAEKAAGLPVGDPTQRGVFMGPVIDQSAVRRYEGAVSEAETHGKVVVGGRRLTEGNLAQGCFVAPTIVEAGPDSWVWSRELFLPYIAVAPVESVSEGIERANDTEYGLTAGFFSQDQTEVDRFLEEIEAGVVYVNRRAGATTGAWPAVQPFGGWKGSGTGGKSGGGPYYVVQYMREQSRTVVER